MLSRLKRGYQAIPPTIVNCARYGTLFCGAELTQQWYVKKHLTQKEGVQQQPFDTKKLKDFALYSYIAAPSYMALWYRWLEPRYPGTALRTVVTKVVLDQTLLTIPLLCMFFPWMSWCQGKEHIFQELMDKFFLTYSVSCIFWLPAQAFNFKVIPPKYRILYNGVMGFVWAFILCIIKRQGEDEGKD